MSAVERLSTGAAFEFRPAQGAEAIAPAALLVHGWRSSIFQSSTIDEIVNGLSSAGVHSMLLSLRGHDLAEGDINTVSRQNHTADLVAAYQYLLARAEVDGERICGLGRSYGGYLLAASSNILTFRNLVLAQPALYADDGWAEPMAPRADTPDMEWRKLLHVPKDSRALLALADYHFHARVLLVTSGKDEFMPAEVGESYLTAIRPTQVLPITYQDAEHVLRADDRKDYIERATKWLVKSIED